MESSSQIDNFIKELEEYKKETKMETVLSFVIANSIKENKDLLNSYMETGEKYIKNDIIKEIIKNDVSKVYKKINYIKVEYIYTLVIDDSKKRCFLFLEKIK